MAEREFLGGVTNTTLHFESDGTLHIEEKQDAEPILDYTHAARNHRFDAYSDSGEYRHEAEIPVTVYLAECKKRGMDWAQAMRALGGLEGTIVIESILADPQYAKFRASPRVDPQFRIKGLR
jgi:hypothetical protein